MRQFFCGLVLGLTLTSVSVIAAPGDEFRGDLDVWADQQRKDQSLRESTQPTPRDPWKNAPLSPC